RRATVICPDTGISPDRKPTRSLLPLALHFPSTLRDQWNTSPFYSNTFRFTPVCSTAPSQDIHRHE
ncbi:hypothetical protein OAA19_02605, partial [Rubripirellula sp.]